MCALDSGHTHRTSGKRCAAQHASKRARPQHIKNGDWTWMVIGHALYDMVRNTRVLQPSLDIAELALGSALVLVIIVEPPEVVHSSSTCTVA